MQSIDTMWNQDQLREIVFEEWKHIQAVIARKSEARLKFRGWLYTLLSALFLADFSKQIELSRWTFLALASLMVFLFTLKEYIIHVEHIRAINRSRELETFLREGGDVAAPCLTDKMTKPLTIKESIKAVKDPTFFAQYLLIYITVVLFSLFSS
jgi:hypothetical protein